MVLFLLFLEVLGIGAFLIGLLSTWFLNWMGLSETTAWIVPIVLVLSLCYLYILAINQFFLKLYQEMKLNIKTLNLKDKIILQSTLLLLMMFHFYSLSWLETKMDNLLHYSALVLFLSFFLGLAIKGLLDESYQIKSTNETQELIFNR